MVQEKENVDVLLSTSGREITISRVLRAPIELVWEVWTKPEHIKNWWGPNGFTNTIHQMDVKPGGEWNFIMHGPDGTDYQNKSVFKEIIKHKKIVYDHISGPKFRATIEFEKQNDKTFIKWNMLFESKEEFVQVIKTFKADEGLKQNVDKLDAYLEKGIAVVIERIFNASVEKVWKAITDLDQMKQWYFPQLEAFKPEVGFETQFNVHHEGRDYFHIWKIKEIIPLKKISIEWKYKGYPGNSLVNFELFPDGNKTKLVLTHEKIETFIPEKYPELAKKNFTEGWTQFMDKGLKEFLEK
jgi:uncharacterized protein YndB with AHSA1/START domain